MSYDVNTKRNFEAEKFRKSLPDDTVEYRIFLLDPKESSELRREKLRKIQLSSKALLRIHLKNYIWQREPFDLDIIKENNFTVLYGKTNFGDSIEDEWLVVYLLRELSQQFPEAWIQITDADGEFLLVEAANVLPKWLNPEVADNRVWLNNAQLLIIPRSERSITMPQALTLSIPDALDYLSSNPRSSLLHARLLEEEAFYRLRNYPAQIQANLHHALVTIPRRLAFVLHAKPSHISPAVEAFYLRDPISLKPLRDSTSGSLSFPPDDLVTARIKFTKVGFAQLKSQEFSAPNVWAQVLSPNSGTKVRERQKLGMKVACGMEMLVSDPANVDRKDVREIKLLLEDLDAGEEVLPNDIDIRSWGLEEDDDSWLDIDFNDFEAELQGKHKMPEDNSARAGEFGDQIAQENLRKMVQRFEDFMNEDDLEDMDEDDEEESNSSNEDEIVSLEDKDASFDEDEFTAMMREMMGMPKEVLGEIMGRHASKAHGIAREDASINSEVLRMRKKPVFGPERPPHLTTPHGIMPEVADFTSSEPSATNNAGSYRKVGLGIPERRQNSTERNELDGVAKVEEQFSDDTSDEELEIKKLAAAFEAELRPLLLNRGSKRKIKELKTGPSNDLNSDKDDSEGELEDDNYNLISNMLESFKSQHGLSGPGGNLLGMMGMKLPRDDEHNEEIRNAV